MRRICTLLLFCLFACQSAVAGTLDSDFSIRNGIKFGLSKDEVIRIEEQNRYLPDKEEENSLLYDNLQLADRDCNIFYTFKDGALTNIRYNHARNTDDQVTFATWEDALTQKYGEAMWSSERGDKCPLHIPGGRVGDDSVLNYNTAKWTLDKHNEWLIPFEIGYLKIEHSNGSLSAFGLNIPGTCIEYFLFTKEEGKQLYDEFVLKELNATPTPAPIDISNAL